MQTRAFARAHQFQCFALSPGFLPFFADTSRVAPTPVRACNTPPLRIYGEIVKRRLKNSRHIPSPSSPPVLSYDRRIYILHFRRVGMRAKRRATGRGGRQGGGNTLALPLARLRQARARARDHDPEGSCGCACRVSGG